MRQTFGASIKSRKVLKEREIRMYEAEDIKAVSYEKDENTVNREVIVTKEKKRYRKQ